MAVLNECQNAGFSSNGKVWKYVAATMLFMATLGVLNLSAKPSNPLAGRWDLTITTPKGELPSWIEVSEDNGKNNLVMVGVTDHATPLEKFAISGTHLQFVSPKGEEGFANDMQFSG